MRSPSMSICCSLIQAPFTLRSVFDARATPCLMASSKLVSDVALISVMRATDMSLSLPFRARRSPGVRSLDAQVQHLAADDQPLDLAGPFADLGQFGVAQEALHFVLLDVAVAAVHLHGVVRGT